MLGTFVSPNPVLSLLRQDKLQDYYLDMQFMREYTDETLAIANAWLDPEVPCPGGCAGL